ncbi:MAG TPA: hypothetical protein VII05_00825 [Gaiellaceae bacterium]
MHTFRRTLTGFRRRALLLVALALALAVVGTAISASTSTSYKGQVKGGGALSFRTTTTSVVGFKASTSPVCISVAAASSSVKIYFVRLQSPKPLKNGHFTINYHGPSSTYITVTGTTKGNSASGRINLHYTLTSGTTIYACQQKATWTAKKA